RGLAACLDVAEERRDIRVVVITGAGGVFSAGGDVTLMAKGESIFGRREDPDARLAAQIEAQRRTVVRLSELSVPSIAVLPGAAVGAGLALALACDLRYGGESATLMTGFVRVGLAGDFGCSWLLHRLLPAGVARELLLTARPVDAGEAVRLGLLGGVFADAELQERSMRIAHALADRSAPAVEAIRSMARSAPGLTLAEACDQDATTHARLIRSAEHESAVAALLADRSRS
ncbi:MAG: enoyl-CoA hydratase-related protein, partial [Aeromicrobium sp.]